MLKACIFNLSFALLFPLAWSACYRKPQGANGDSSPVNENYQILIDGNPATYLPGQQYNSRLLFEQNIFKNSKSNNFSLIVNSFPILCGRLKVYQFHFAG